ncbi:DUF402 domain-containing protein [Filobacillus milosensis]|uniref:DUF402 domain-containing protein n=1 Tax=Filobacillus milosensis TaxID=94137 RepID=A0A4Y8IQB0_9BACI|nr:DUF402 domain-containing protein [Filobacillus milosensis]TFB22856.1 DUF402 domain-containing protein [Filobacillus milosensis]
MLKRKYADRRHWSRILENGYYQKYVKTSEYSGYITLFTMKSVQEKLTFTYGDEEVCVVDNGYAWMQHFPDDDFYSVTTSFNEMGEPVQFYFDICRGIGTEDGVPYLDDLFVDVVYLPSGKVIVLDEDELDEALEQQEIDEDHYQFAQTTTQQVIQKLEEGYIPEIDLAKEHKKLFK